MGGGSSKSSPVGSPNKSPSMTPVGSKRIMTARRAANMDVVSILGVQGVGKSTVMKQFHGTTKGGSGKFQLPSEKAFQVKCDILRSVIMRTRMLMTYLIEDRAAASPGGQVDANICHLLDDFSDLARDLLTENLDFTQIYEFMPHLEKLWNVDKLKAVNSDELVNFKIAEKLESAEKEQLFQSGAHYVERISEIMREDYVLSRSDYLQCRSWTQGFNEFDFNTGAGVNVTIRDVGGDEVNRANHWAAAIKDSFCVLFVISLSDYTRTETDGDTKFRTSRCLLWNYLMDKGNPKIILLCNKRDLFHQKLKQTPLHEGCAEFKNVSPQAERESFEDYCSRCEKLVAKFFNQMPNSVRSGDAAKKRKEDDPDFNLKSVKLQDTFMTQATDEGLFGGIITNLVTIFSRFLNDCLHKQGFC